MMTSNKSWFKIREVGSLWGMAFLFAIYRNGGRILFKTCLVPVVLLYYLFHRTARNASRQYRTIMESFCPGESMTKPWHGFRHLWCFAITILDKIAVWSGSVTTSDVEIFNAELIDQLLARKQGAILLVSHLGNFEVCQALSQGRPDLRLTVLHHAANSEKFNRFLDKHAQNRTVTFMEVKEVDVAQAILLSERIAAGHFIAVSADRLAVENAGRSIFKTFLGHPAQFPIGPFILGMTLRAPMLMVNCIKRQGRYHIYFDEIADETNVPRAHRKVYLEQLIERYVRRLEQYCLLAPWQWFNFYPYWPSPLSSAKIDATKHETRNER